MICLARVNETNKTPTIISLFDLKACFDKIRMNDVFLDVAMTGADMKAVKVLHEFTKEVKIKGILTKTDRLLSRTRVIKDPTSPPREPVYQWERSLKNQFPQKIVRR